jgi:uncharacterized protein (TIGR02001 family)
MKKLLATSIIAASAVTGFSNSAMAEVEIAGSATVASTYLWRGYDLGSGTPAVSGDVVASAGGAYGGVWVSSGDTATGTEYDLFAGYGLTSGDFSIDLSVWNYVYPTGGSGLGFSDLTEVILSVGFGPVSVAYYDNVAGGSGYEYYTVSGEAGKFSATVGMHDNVTGDDPTHLTVNYAYNDSFTLTASQFVSDEPTGDDLQFVVSYSLAF